MTPSERAAWERANPKVPHPSPLSNVMRDKEKERNLIGYLNCFVVGKEAEQSLGLFMASTPNLTWKGC